VSPFQNFSLRSNPDRAVLSPEALVLEFQFPNHVLILPIFHLMLAPDLPIGQHRMTEGRTREARDATASKGGRAGRAHSPFQQSLFASELSKRTSAFPFNEREPAVSARDIAEMAAGKAAKAGGLLKLSRALIHSLDKSFFL